MPLRAPTLVRLALLASMLFSFAGCTAATGGSGDPGGDESEQAEAHAEIVFSASDLVERFDHVDGYAQSGVIPAHDGATRAGFLLDTREGSAAAPPLVEVRGVRDDGSTGEWRTVESTFDEPPHAVLRVDFAEVVSGTQFRIPLEQVGDVAQITYAAVIPEELPDSPDETGVGQTEHALSSALASLVQPRSAWKARPTKCTGKDKAKYRMAIHHTFTGATSSSGYEARLRAIQAYHMDTRGWCDVGYHFLITQDGRIWEARPFEHTGAHVGNNNSGNIGISWVGCFEPGGACNGISPTIDPPQAMLDAGAAIIKKLSALHGIAINSSNIKGHGSHPGASTACPGKNMDKRMPAMLDAAKSGSSTPPLPPAATTKGRVVGVVWDLSTGSSPSGSALRVTNASISVNGGAGQPVRATDAYWEVELTPGNYTIAAAAPGYASAQQTVSVAGAQTVWASIGLTPSTTVTSTQLTVTLTSTSNAKLSNGIVHAPGFGASRADADGNVRLTLPPGTRTLTAYHDGYAATLLDVTIPAASSHAITLALAPAAPLSSKGRVQGVVWDQSVTSTPSASGNQRLDHAIVLCSCGQAQKARAGDAFWLFDAPPGNHTITVLADGYATETSSVSLTNGANVWNSVGLSPGN